VGARGWEEPFQARGGFREGSLREEPRKWMEISIPKRNRGFLLDEPQMNHSRARDSP
jgi:hypothetical protein